MDRILLERLGIGWKDSVSEANEKRMKDAEDDRRSSYVVKIPPRKCQENAEKCGQPGCELQLDDVNVN